MKSLIPQMMGTLSRMMTSDPRRLPITLIQIFMALVTDSIGIFIPRSLVSRLIFLPWCSPKLLSVGQPCDKNGTFLETGTPPPPKVSDPANWAPFKDRVQFEIADLLYTRIQLAASQINALMDLWACTLLPHNHAPPFANCRALHNVIDSIPLGDVKWQHFNIQYTGDVPNINSPPWMQETYEVWYCDSREVVHQILGNTSFANSMDL